MFRWPPIISTFVLPNQKDCQGPSFASLILLSATLETKVMTATAIPLTTVFSPAAACTTDTWYIEYLSGTYHYDTAISATDAGWWLSQGPKEWSSCFPSGYKAATDFYFSPGLCPSGYTVASQSTDSLDGNVETRATCCPS